MKNTTKEIDLLYKYENGNTLVSIYTDGTKVREYDNIPVIEHPESIDVKITNYCDLGCSYCHESSTIEGKHADLNVLLKVFKDLPAGVELAIGGGNPLSHPDILWFLQQLKAKGFIANLTVNQGHLMRYYDVLVDLIKDKLIFGLGISITNNNFTYVKKLKELSDNIVYHLIAGVNDVSIINKLIEIGDCKLLLLGYKTFGFGVNYNNIFSSSIQNNIDNWIKVLPKILTKLTVSFDNLAIEQLQVRKLLTKEAWEQFYMGDDFVYTMYIDAVKQEYAPTSRSNNRISFNNCSLLNYFKQ